MKFDKKVLATGLIAAVLAQVGNAHGSPDNSNPYSRIVARNAFALRDPPPVPENKPVIAPPGKILLQGVTTILGRKQVLLKLQPPAPGKELSMILGENQREGEVEVIEINQAAGSITVKNSGIEQVLTFEKDAAKPAGNPVTVNLASAAPPPTMASPVPAAVPTPNLAATTGSTGKGFKTTTPRNVRSGNGYGLAAANTGSGALPGRGGMSLEEQTVIMEVQREVTKDAVNAGEMPPLPPTDATHLLSPPTPSPAPRNR